MRNHFAIELSRGEARTMRLCKHLIIFLAAKCLTSAAVIPEVPSFLKVCHRSDPNLNECLKESINSLRPYLKNGIPALQVPACEPLRLTQIEINQSSGPIYVRAKYNDVSIFGGTNFVLRHVRLDLKRNLLHLKLYVPRLEMTANYTMEGRIMMLPIVGDGVGHGNFTDVDAVIALQFEPYKNERTGQIHQRVAEIYVDFDIGHAAMHLDNLFDGDETLASAMNLFLNDNWKTVIAEIRPKLEETITGLINEFTNQILSSVPQDTLLPP